MAKTRVLVVEDSLTIRRRLCEVLGTDPDIEIVGEAADGERAVEACQEHRPDVVTMDMMLPNMSGLAATEYIMAHCPTPILICSSSLNRGELFKTYEALAAGAVDVLDKPRGDETDGTWERHFIETVKLVARIRVITHPRARLGALGRDRSVPVSATATPARVGTSQPYRVAAIGASTGGPGAIVEILRALPADFRLPVLLVLHISEPFAVAFTEWLDRQSSRRVVCARDGDLIAAHAGRVVMAPSDRHLVVRGGRLRLTREAERNSCRPSVDVLFESMAKEYGPAAVAVLLTGMGRDGASGLLEIRKAGGLTVAQDEATSVIFGMPYEAIALGAAVRVLPLGQIGAFLGSIPSGVGEGTP
jgi:two-component system chemotaxis response regulator CheB